jgi:hypothetical protein
MYSIFLRKNREGCPNISKKPFQDFFMHLPLLGPFTYYNIVPLLGACKSQLGGTYIFGCCVFKTYGLHEIFIFICDSSSCFGFGCCGCCAVVVVDVVDVVVVVVVVVVVGVGCEVVVGVVVVAKKNDGVPAFFWHP